MIHPPSERRDGRAGLFDQVADLYAAARPAYPQKLLDDFSRLTGMSDADRVLEIGAGTGQLTVFLAEQAVDLVAIERGPNLARLLAKNVARFPRVQIVCADFDLWEGPSDRFDVIAAATAFHWLDPSTRLARCGSLLRPGGTLAIVSTHWGAGARDDRFVHESQGCYAAWDPAYDPAYRPACPDDLPERHEELEQSGLFAKIAHRRYLCRRAYSARGYCDLLGTFSGVLAIEETGRRRFLACMRALIEARFDGTVVRTDVHDLWLARTPH